MAYYDVEILRDAQGNPIPQFYDESEGAFKPLTEKSSVEDATAHTKLDSILNKLNDKINTEVTGRNVEHDIIKLFDGLQLRDANTKGSQEVDVSIYSGFEIWIENTLDQPITVRVNNRLDIGGRNIKFFDGTEWKDTYYDRATLPPSPQFVYQLSSFFPFILEYKGDKITLSIQAETSPTSGNFSVWFVGVHN